MATDKVLVGVIGGSGLYNLSNLTFVEELTPTTPWGPPSSPITISALPSGARVAFLARHGTTHTLPPSALPYRANIAALKSLGVRAVLAFSAVGSLREEIAPGDFCLPAQLIDRTTGARPSSFFDGTGVVAHAGFGDPYSPRLAGWLEGMVREALDEEGRGVRLHVGGTLVVMEGPQFSTRAESLMYRVWGGDLIGMTGLPEAKLAREAEIAFALIATATDYDAWRPHEAGVTAAEVGAILRQNADTSRHVAAHVIERLLAAHAAELAAHAGELAGGGEAATESAPPPKEKKTLLDEEAGSMRFALMAPPGSVRNAALAYVLPEYFTV